ncbi:MAG: ABC transporter permease [Chitinophagales bacterium]|jgi:putative ABC transport system permease protein|nr:ABC transporter permease [Chitinophagales bacterium]
MNFRDVLSLAFRTVRGNKLRTGLTVAIIAFGIMALVGIITAIKAMNQKFTESFSTMGANAFTIRFKERNIRFGGGGNSDVKLSKKGSRKEKKSNLDKKITLDEAELFVNRFGFPATKSISVFGNRSNIVSHEARKTSPNVTMFGGDDNYLLLNGFSLAFGRNLNRMDVQTGRNVCILGYDVASKLFKEGIERAENAVVRLNNIPYRVIGVLESRGSTFGFSRDNVVITTYKNSDRNFPSSFSFVIAVMTEDILKVPAAMGEAEGAFRAIRKLNTTEENNFVLDRSDSVAEKAMNSLGFLTISATVIGFITLIGAAIGLMNIMLVSVSERTKEVGLIKAIGGKSKMVRRQFLLEAIIISLLGAFFGIILGIMVGNLFSKVLNTGFVVPWNWVLYGIVICTLVGLAAGSYPAWKAGKLNPIDALRYE